MTREQKLALIWRHTHQDFKGVREDGTRSILVYRQGTTAVPLDDLTDAEINDRLPRAKRLQNA